MSKEKVDKVAEAVAEEKKSAAAEDSAVQENNTWEEQS